MSTGGQIEPLHLPTAVQWLMWLGCWANTRWASVQDPVAATRWGKLPSLVLVPANAAERLQLDRWVPPQWAI